MIYTKAILQNKIANVRTKTITIREGREARGTKGRRFNRSISLRNIIETLSRTKIHSIPKKTIKDHIMRMSK